MPTLVTVWCLVVLLLLEVNMESVTDKNISLEIFCCEHYF